ncbi:MAG: tetratricopeptide repeat protein [Bacteroidales bacterium]|nr:tetratricopeptide repeat protein [Bacteroidales bacterium]
MKRFLAALAAALTVASAGAQEWSKAKQYYDAGMFSEAIASLKGQAGAMAEGYRTLASQNLKLPNRQELADAYLHAWPESVLAPQVSFFQALDYFDQEKFAEALMLLGEISQADLQKSQLPEYTYKLGYSAYRAGEWPYASQVLARVPKLPYSDYTAPSCYTLGYINYAQGNFSAAEEWFEKAAGDYRFQSLAGYYILECRFNEKDYSYVIKNGDRLLDEAPEDRKPRLARIISESYLVRGDVDKARTYYNKHLTREQAQTRADYFYAGELMYLDEDWAGAAAQFEKVADKPDSLGQMASYQLGYSNLQLRNKVAALDAFNQAARLSFTPDIQEDAFFNYAKLAFDLGRDTAPFQEYIQRFGTKARGDQIYSYMAMVALQNHDYGAAVEAYDQLDNLDPAMQSNYMKAYFLRARQLMEMGSWRAAVPHLKTAAYYSPARDGFNQLSRYWMAEAYYRDGKYADARGILTDLYNLSALGNAPEGELIPYQIAYTYFKEANYEQALRWFNNYLSGRHGQFGGDASTRIGDCYFFQGDYVTAISAYEKKMADYPDKDDLYPGFRAGVASGLLQNDQQKVRFLEGVKRADKTAPYYSETLYELGRAYVSVGRSDDAKEAFQTLLQQTGDPSMAALATLELGTIARNQGMEEEALRLYKQVVSRGGDYAEDALLAIESIYRSRQDPDAYLAYVNSLGGGNARSEQQKEEVYFSTAEQIFLSGDYTKAATTLQTYLERYPKPEYGAKARFYLGECYRMSGALEQAADQYQAALEEGLDAALEESALLQYANLNYGLGNYGKAYGSYLKLQEKARLDENRQNAAIGLMRSAYRAKEWNDAIESADALVSSKDAALQREARYVRAKSYLSSSRRTEAFADFKELAKQPSTDEGAEAAYLVIQDLFDRASFSEIQGRVYDFSDKAGGQNYWLAKAFIVLGDTFAEQGNKAQARATFESIRSGYTPTGEEDDVLDQVEVRLRKLQ